MKKTISLILVSFLILSFILPFNLFASSSYTWIPILANQNSAISSANYNTVVTNGLNVGNNNNAREGYIVGQSPAVALKCAYYGPDNSNNYTVVVAMNGQTYLALNSTDYIFTNANYVSDNWTTTNLKKSNNMTSFNNGSIYYKTSTQVIQSKLNSNIPIYSTKNSALQAMDDGIWVMPSPINYGYLKDLGYSTKFTNSQQDSVTAMRNNVDILTWDSYQDTNGNQINTFGMWVDIQAFRTEYYATTLQTY